MSRPAARTLVVSLVVASCLAAAAPSRAAADAQATLARRLASAAASDFKAGRFAEAAEQWEAAYKAQPDPGYQYLLGRVYAIDGKPAQAAAAYRLFLEKAPRSAPKRADAQAKLAELEKQHPELARAAAPPPAATVAPLPGNPSEDGALGPQLPAAPPSAPAAVAAPVVAPAAAAPSAAERTPVTRTWWLWTAVGGGALVVAGVAIGVGVALSGSSGFPEIGPGAAARTP